MILDKKRTDLWADATIAAWLGLWNVAADILDRHAKLSQSTEENPGQTHRREMR